MKLFFFLFLHSASTFFSSEAFASGDFSHTHFYTFSENYLSSLTLSAAENTFSKEVEKYNLHSDILNEGKKKIEKQSKYLINVISKYFSENNILNLSHDQYRHVISLAANIGKTVSIDMIKKQENIDEQNAKFNIQKEMDQRRVLAYSEKIQAEFDKKAKEQIKKIVSMKPEKKIISFLQKENKVIENITLKPKEFIQKQIEKKSTKQDKPKEKNKKKNKVVNIANQKNINQVKSKAINTLKNSPQGKAVSSVVDFVKHPTVKGGVKAAGAVVEAVFPVAKLAGDTVAFAKHPTVAGGVKVAADGLSCAGPEGKVAAIGLKLAFNMGSKRKKR
jgi:superfamily II DNA helicase RecQ